MIKRTDEILSAELSRLKTDYENCGAERFYRSSYNDFRRTYPKFTEKVIENFLENYVEVTEQEMKDPEIISEWEKGKLIFPEDWDPLFAYAERVINGKRHTWREIYPDVCLQ